MFEYRSVAELFSKVSQPAKVIKKTGLPSAKHVTGKGGLASILKDRPELVYARAAGMPPVADGFTVLHAAFAAGNLVTVRWLLDNVVDFFSALATGETTADGTQSDYYKLNVDARDQQGRTALHVAWQLGQSEVVCHLFEVLDKMAGQDGEEEETDSEEEEDEEIDVIAKGVAGLSTWQNDSAATNWTYRSPASSFLPEAPERREGGLIRGPDTFGRGRDRTLGKGYLFLRQKCRKESIARGRSTTAATKRIRSPGLCHLG